MTLIQKIRTSFSTQLSLWVAGFVLVISGVVIFLLARFSEDVIRDESIDTTMLALENTALHIDNTLRQTEMTARLERYFGAQEFVFFWFIHCYSFVEFGRNCRKLCYSIVE